MASTNKQGWKLSDKICVKKNIDNLYVVLVRLKELNKPVEYYINKYDELAGIIDRNYLKYMSKPKRNGESKADTSMRWHNFSDFLPEDYVRCNAY